MDEEITIINTNTRNEKIKKFFLDNKKNLIIISSIIVIVTIGYFSFNEIKKINKAKLADQFNSTVFSFKEEKKEATVSELKSIIKKKDTTYSPLALYFLIDNNLIDNNEDINNLFDVLIDDTSLKKEVKNLIIYKKALFNSNTIEENELIKLLNPIINSDSIWKSHSLYLIAEFFYSKNEKQKSKEFFNKILELQNSNTDIKLKSQKRLNKDFRE
jgi:predicted negative regulator of RcsB-dependent stress response|tara:strand:+ start:432 stop:1076 length:645 start_codon:yes stop_codon:yes gene_type:complete